MNKRFVAVLVFYLIVVDIEGFRIQATCKSSTSSIEGGGPVTYPACELPPRMGVWRSWNTLSLRDTLSLRWGVKRGEKR